MAITSLQEFRNLINSVLATNGEDGDVPNAPHKGFWDTMSYVDFTTGNVPGVTDGGHPVRILIPGDSANSNIIQALQGIGIFSPTGSQDRMPANGPPWFTPEQISQLAAWIDNHCPDPAKP